MSVPLRIVQTPQNETVPQRLRLEYLDGLRGLAAVYVVLGHLYVALRFFSTEIRLPSPLLAALSVFNIGQTAVDVFIVLSGYVLMLPVVRAGGEMRGGVLPYLQRRARRILPPYYAALALSLLLIAAMNATGLNRPPDGDYLRPDVLLSHLLLIHNWRPDWNHAIDPPMWSVAVEWQIYFLFPWLLLPVWKRFGVGACVAAGFAVGLAPHFLANGGLDWSFPWFLGLFAQGMAAAVIGFSPDPNMVRLRRTVPWGWLALTLGGGILGFCLLRRGWYASHQWLADPIIGAAAMCLLLYCTAHRTGDRPGETPRLLRLFEWRPAVMAGAFSYSLYLMHYPLLVLFFQLMMRVPLSGLWRVVILYGLGFPLLLALCYLFHLAFERRFLPGAASRPSRS